GCPGTNPALGNSADTSSWQARVACARVRGARRKDAAGELPPHGAELESFVQLDRVPPRPASVSDGTLPPSSGVEAGETSLPEVLAVPHRPARVRVWLGAALLSFMLLGTGERWKADARFRSPST